MVFHLNAQTPVTPDLPEDRLITYFDALRESVFLHLNKTAFIPGEEVWFKAYVYDRKNHKPFIETTNLNVAIYDSVGDFLANNLSIWIRVMVLEVLKLIALLNLESII